MADETYKEIFEQFARTFRDGRSGEPLAYSEIDNAESRLSTRLPERYREFLASYGPVYTPQLLRIVSALPHKECELYDLQQLYSGNEIASETLAYREAGMPSNLVGIGYDCMSNLFAFQAVPFDSPRPEDAPIYVFDHDFRVTNQVAESFAGLLRSFLAMSGEAA